MKNYIATFSRYNPQTFHSYETHFDISAENMTQAKKQARAYERNCHYGSLILLGVELKKEG